MIVRPERAADYAAITAVVDAAFGDLDTSRLVADLRASPGSIADLALVAEDDDGDVVGHVMFTVTSLESGDAILMLSPLAVRPDRQRAGVGTALVGAGLEGARRRSEPLVIVEGDPRYYGRFGFVEASSLGLERPYESIPPHAFQALALRRDHPRGRVTYPPPFDRFY